LWVIGLDEPVVEQTGRVNVHTGALAASAVVIWIAAKHNTH